MEMKNIRIRILLKVFAPGLGQAKVIGMLMVMTDTIHKYITDTGENIQYFLMLGQNWSAYTNIPLGLVLFTQSY